MFDFGVRQRCENCKYGHCEYDYKRKAVRAYCSKINKEINGKLFNSLMNCLHFERDKIK